MRQQRANLVASVAVGAALAGAVPAALLALGDAFGPASWPRPDGSLLGAPPMALPRVEIPSRHHATIIPAPRVHRSTIRAVPRAGASTIIPSFAAAGPQAGLVATRPVVLHHLTTQARRTTASPRAHSRLVAERRADTSHLTSTAVAPRESTPTAPAPTAAVALSPKAAKKAERDARKQERKALKQLEKLARADG